MSARRFTPPPKEFSNSASRRTPTAALNITSLTAAGGSVSRTYRHGSASKLFRDKSINLNNTVSAGCPVIKGCLLNSHNAEDKKLECDMVYNDYLQALMKQQIVSSTIKKHDQDMKDQLAIQKDNVHKTKLTLKELRMEVENLDVLSQVDQLTTTLQESANKFSYLIESFDLNELLKDLLEIFELLCNKVQVKNIKNITDQESIDKLTQLLEKCVEVLKKLVSSGRSVESIIKLGEAMKKYQQLTESVAQKQAALNKQHSNGIFKLLKNISDLYAQRENYSNDVSFYRKD